MFCMVSSSKTKLKKCLIEIKFVRTGDSNGE